MRPALCVQHQLQLVSKKRVFSRPVAAGVEHKGRVALLALDALAIRTNRDLCSVHLERFDDDTLGRALMPFTARILLGVTTKRDLCLGEGDTVGSFVFGQLNL